MNYEAPQVTIAFSTTNKHPGFGASQWNWRRNENKPSAAVLVGFSGLFDLANEQRLHMVLDR